MWDDYMGWDWYAFRQMLFFSGFILVLISLISMTEGHPWHHPISWIAGRLLVHRTMTLIGVILLIIAGFRFIMYKEGFD